MGAQLLGSRAEGCNPDITSTAGESCQGYLEFVYVLHLYIYKD